METVTILLKWKADVNKADRRGQVWWINEFSVHIDSAMHLVIMQFNICNH